MNERRAKTRRQNDLSLKTLLGVTQTPTPENKYNIPPYGTGPVRLRVQPKPMDLKAAPAPCPRIEKASHFAPVQYSPLRTPYPAPDYMQCLHNPGCCARLPVPWTRRLSSSSLGGRWSWFEAWGFGCVRGWMSSLVVVREFVPRRVMLHETLCLTCVCSRPAWVVAG